MKSFTFFLVGMLCIAEWNFAQFNGQKKSIPKYPCSMDYMAISPDGKILASTGRHVPWPSAGIQAWDLSTLSLVWNSHFSKFSPRPMAVNALAFSPNGKIVAIGDWAGGVTLINAITGQQKKTISFQGVQDLTFSRSGDFIAVSTQTGITHILSTADGSIKVTLEGTTLGWSLAVSPDGKLLAIADSGAAHIFDTHSGKKIHSYLTSPPRSTKSDSLKGVVYRVALNEEGRVLATATSDYVQVWDVQTEKELFRTKAGNSTPGSLAFSADGTQLGWANYNHEIRLWPFSKSKNVRIVKVWSLLGRVVFRPDFKLAYVSAHETSMSVVELPTGRELSAITCTDFVSDEPIN